MGIGRALLLAMALLAVVCLPAAIALLFCADELIDRVVCGFAEWREARRERRTVARLNRAVGATALARTVDLGEFDRADRPGIEQIAADLRRLAGHYRPALAERPAFWPEDVVRAYDDQLRLACRCLGLTEHLAELTGVDQQIERIRVEGQLHDAGLRIPTVGTGHPEHLP